ncbi:cutinase family protein [Corynebacterium tapiri]|uniref:cutinase family protein n=1 Tax=Corynebacterium tapiri TaxID=1448266 RepID=UPI0015D60D11|nr:cutinase family protein [Corynebacterium tapiri]
MSLSSKIAATVCAAFACVASAVNTPAMAQQSSLGLATVDLGPQGNCTAHTLINVPGGLSSAQVLQSNVGIGWVAPQVVSMAPQMLSDTSVITANYDATPFLNDSYDSASNSARHVVAGIMAERAQACPNTKFSIVGYSMGADIAATLTSEIAAGRGPISADKFEAGVFVANPHRGGTPNQSGAPAGHGILGPGMGYGELTPRTLDICNAGDLVCDPQANWRTVAETAGTGIGLGQGKFPGAGEMNQALAAAMPLNPFEVSRAQALHNVYGAPQVGEALGFIAAHQR